MKLFMLKDGDRFYRRRNRWTTDPQKATVWTTKQGAAASKGHCFPQPAGLQIVSFDVELPESIAAASTLRETANV